MTNIFIEEINDTLQIKISGHSGYSTSGTDIVCAAVSILAHSWTRICVEMADMKKVDLVELEIREGYMNAVIKDVKKNSLSAWKMLKCGIEDLAEEYPQNLSLEWGEMNF